MGQYFGKAKQDLHKVDCLSATMRSNSNVSCASITLKLEYVNQDKNHDGDS